MMKIGLLGFVLAMHLCSSEQYTQSLSLRKKVTMWRNNRIMQGCGSRFEHHMRFDGAEY